MMVLRGGESGTCRRVVTAYEETVMSVPHYNTVYGDSPAASLAAEFGTEVAAGLDSGFTPPLKGALLDATRQAIEQRETFDGTLAAELDSLTAARESLSEIDSVLESVVARERESTTATGTEATLTRQEERCEEVAAARQRLRRDRLLPEYVDADDLCSYLYREYDWTYPVLSAVAALRERIDTIRERVVR
jgi:hypothetical protein